jgi:hypothetical protein
MILRAARVRSKKVGVVEPDGMAHYLSRRFRAGDKKAARFSG